MNQSLTALLRPMLVRHFDVNSLKVPTGDSPIADFPEKHSDVGSVRLYDEGDEVTLVLGKFTHVHFSWDDQRLTHDQRASKIASDVLEFLDNLFADKVELYGGNFTGGGCRGRTGTRRAWLSRLFFGRKSFVWSGPI